MLPCCFLKKMLPQRNERSYHDPGLPEPPETAEPRFYQLKNRSDEINTCIACNQACLDLVFQLKRASCLVNPRACHETELVLTGAPVRRRMARSNFRVLICK